jgi:hypothetical protein
MSAEDKILEETVGVHTACGSCGEDPLSQKRVQIDLRIIPKTSNEETKRHD